MSIEQYIEIAEWILIWREKIHTLKLSQRDVQKMLFEQLKYEVPISTLVRWAKNAKIIWANAPSKPPPAPIEREAIIILMGAIEGLYIETGKTVPDALANLKSAYAREGTQWKQQNVS